MSKIGKQEIQITPGVKVSQVSGVFTVVGPKGTLTKNFRDDIVITITDKIITLLPKRNDKFSK